MTDNAGNISINRQDIDETHSRYVATVSGREGEAELTFYYHDNTVVADHTRAPENLRGTGVALALVKTLVDDMRQEGKKIVPECSYVDVQMKRHGEWTDMIAS